VPGKAGYSGLFSFIRENFAEEIKEMNTCEKRDTGRNGALHPRLPRTDEPVFKSAHGALKFATNYVHGTLKKTAWAMAQGGGGGGGRGLGGLDGAAQAGMICAELMQLSPVWRNVLIARFTIASSPCACRAGCCRGYRENTDWSAAVDYLTEYVLAAGLTGTISHFRLRRALVKRYFGVRDSFVAIADMCGVHRTTAAEYNKAVVEFFRYVEVIAFMVTERRLQEAGIVQV